MGRVKLDDFETILLEGAEQLGISIKAQQIEQFRKYTKFLLQYNLHTNLTSITEPKSIAIKHFLDSIVVSKELKSYKIDLIDIGTGAGFPGVPLKIVCPEINITLLDSLNKRVKFLQELLKELNIEADIFHKRAEELSKDKLYRDRFDVSISRAVAPLNILSEYCMPFVKAGGSFIAMKGPNVEDEIQSAHNAINILQGKLERVDKVELPYGNGRRSIVVIQKVKDTPPAYPRQSAKIIKKPL